MSIRSERGRYAGFGARERLHSLNAERVLLSAVYRSSAVIKFSEVDIALLLAVSRSNNQANEISGLLLHDNGRFVQLLEGPAEAVRATIRIIASDPRHQHVETLAEERIESRRFGSWAMGYRSINAARRPNSGWFGSPEGFASAQHVSGAELIAWFRER